MGQQEIYTFLMKCPSKWFNSEEIRVGAGMSKHSVQSTLFRMHKELEIERKLVRSHWLNYYQLRREQ